PSMSPSMRSFSACWAGAELIPASAKQKTPVERHAMPYSSARNLYFLSPPARRFVGAGIKVKLGFIGQSPSGGSNRREPRRRR
ncbi:MAG TPA: hypothetical protein VL285_11040, partial [Bryobacteraceae bacterium]|nr:hypothetical protein [Bryobacteraceae bacterium]